MKKVVYQKTRKKLLSVILKKCSLNTDFLLIKKKITVIFYSHFFFLLKELLYSYLEYS